MHHAATSILDRDKAILFNKAKLNKAKLDKAKPNNAKLNKKKLILQLSIEVY